MPYLAGQKLRANDLRRIIARHRRTTTSTTTTTTTRTSAQGVCRLAAPLLAGRAYNIYVRNCGVFSPAAGTCGLQLTYTTNGTTPSASSTALDFSQITTPGSSIVVAANVGKVYVPGTDQTFTVLLSVWGVFAGTYGVFGTADWPIDLTIEDIGSDPGSTGTNI